MNDERLGREFVQQPEPLFPAMGGAVNLSPGRAYLTRDEEVWLRAWCAVVPLTIGLGADLDARSWADCCLAAFKERFHG